MTEPRIIARQDHPISRKDIDKDVLWVLYKLKDAGFAAYLVGGAVRDLLMERKPKDFDVATDARPHDLRRLFRNSRVVGRRFKLVHIFFGPKNVEVATLRSEAEPPEDTDDLYVDDDNQWGDLESDAFRRDFTVNALYYDIRDFAVIDYTGGLDDLAAKRVRAIGDPSVRFQEDPVRMLRAIKFAARFDYTLDAATAQALHDNAGEIDKASGHRVLEEFFRIIGQANRVDGLTMLRDFGFLRLLFPAWVAAIGDEGFAQVLEFFRAVDEQAEAERHYPLEILCAGLFLPLLDEVDASANDYNRACLRLTEEIRSLGLSMDLPKRLVMGATEMLRGQYYLIYFHHLPKRVRRFIDSQWYDPTWQLHQLAFGSMSELSGIHAIWIEARERCDRPLGGTVPKPDRRDVFSFRGRSGGGRHGGHRPGIGGGDDEDNEPGWVEDPVLAGVEE